MQMHLKLNGSTREDWAIDKIKTASDELLINPFNVN